MPPSKGAKIAGGRLSEKLRNTWRQIKATSNLDGKQAPGSSVEDDDADGKKLAFYYLNYIFYIINIVTISSSVIPGTC